MIQKNPGWGEVKGRNEGRGWKDTGVLIREHLCIKGALPMRIHPNFTQKLSALQLWQTSVNAFWVCCWAARLSGGSSEGSIKRKASLLLANLHSPPPIRPHPRWPHETWGMLREQSCLAIYNDQFISFFLYHKFTVLRQNFKEPSCSLCAETSETQFQARWADRRTDLGRLTYLTIQRTPFQH